MVDLLELADVSVDDSKVKSNWIFAATPGFVERSSGSLFLFGITPDYDTFLPLTLTKRIRHFGFTRILEPQSNEDIPNRLKDLGLRQLSIRAWLKSPRKEAPENMLASHKEVLFRQPTLTHVENLQIIDSGSFRYLLQR